MDGAVWVGIQGGWPCSAARIWRALFRSHAMLAGGETV